MGRTYGGEFPWVDVAYHLRVDNGFSPLHLINGMTRMGLFTQGIAFSPEGTFYCPEDAQKLFPIGGFDLRWRCEGESILIDFFHKGLLIPWRRDVLQIAKSHVHGCRSKHLSDSSTRSKDVPDLVGIGYISDFSFGYTMTKISANAKIITAAGKHLAIQHSINWLNAFPQSCACNQTDLDTEAHGELVLGECEPPKAQHSLILELPENEKAKLQELETLLLQRPEPPVSLHQQEHRECRFLRFLRDENFDVDSALARLHANASWWLDYGMDNFLPEDEFDERGPCFTCGEDHWGQPVLVCRPCVHFPSSKDDSIYAVRRTVYTVQRCIERLPHGREKCNLIYDARGLQWANLDLTFAKELTNILQTHYPGRVHSIFVINADWLASRLWQIVRPLLGSSTREKVHFGREEDLLAIVDKDHPYLRYVIEVQQLDETAARALPLPKASPYVPHWRDPPLTTNLLQPQSPQPPLSSPASSAAAKVRRSHVFQMCLRTRFFRSLACCW
jgi:hypothetical protein